MIVRKCPHVVQVSGPGRWFAADNRLSAAQIGELLGVDVRIHPPPSEPLIVELWDGQYGSGDHDAELEDVAYSVDVGSRYYTDRSLHSHPEAFRHGLTPVVRATGEREYTVHVVAHVRLA